MWTSQDRDHDDEDGCGEAATERRVEKYDGITVKVQKESSTLDIKKKDLSSFSGWSHLGFVW